MKKIKIKNCFHLGWGVIILPTLFFFTACDFTPKIHRDILNAQQALVQQNFKEAVRQYESILEKNPDSEIKVKIYYQLGEIYSLNFGEYEKAIEHYRRVQRNSNEPIWLVRSEERIGEISFSFLRNYYKSQKSYEYLKSFTPRLSDYDLYEYRIGMSLFKNRNYENALEIFKEIIENSNHEYYEISIYQIGLIYFEKQNWDEAIKYWTRYIREESNQDRVVRTKFLMANAFERKEELKKAYNMYYSILGEYPNVDVVQNRLNSIYNRRVARKR